MAKHKLLTLGTLVAFVIGIVIFFQINNKEAGKTNTIPTDNQPTIRHQGATRHLVVFEDLKCGACKFYNTRYYPTLKKNFIDTGKMDYTVIPLAFIHGSMPAANAAYCLYHQQKHFFFEFVDYIYQHQPNERLDWANDTTLVAFAQKVPGADIVKLQKCMLEQTYYPQLKANQQLATELLGSIRTPSFFMNGKQIENINSARMKKLAEEGY